MTVMNEVRDAGQIAEEVIAHLAGLSGAQVRFCFVHRGDAEGAERLQLVSLRARGLGGEMSVSQVTPKWSIPDFCYN